MMIEKCIKSISVIVVISALFMSVTGPAHATSCCSSWKEYFPLLGKSDFGLFNQAAHGNMEAKPVGTLNTWENRDSGNSGTVQFILRYQSENNECRKLWHILKFQQRPKQLWEVNVCKIGHSWILNQPPKRL